MPKKYEKIKSRLKKSGVGDKAAKRSAARIYNATRKKGRKPVTGRCKK